MYLQNNPFFANISSNLVLQNWATYEMVMLNMITIRNMNVEYLWLTSL